MQPEGSVPDLFTDGVKVNAGPYGVTLTLHRSTAESMASDDDDIGPVIAYLRMNAALAEALAGVLMRVVELDKQHHKKRDAQSARTKKKSENGEKSE